MPAGRRLRRLPQVSHGPTMVSRLLEVRGQLAGDLARAVAMTDLPPLPDRLVPGASLRGWDSPVERAAMQRMKEPVTRRHRPVGPLLGAEGADEELPAGQFVAAFLDRAARPLQGRGHRGHREFHAGHAAHAEDSLLVLSELPEASLDHLTEVLGDADVDLLQRRMEFPPLVAHADEIAGDEIVDHVHHEQRIALGPPVDDARQRGGKGVSGEPPTQILGHGRFVQ